MLIAIIRIFITFPVNPFEIVNMSVNAENIIGCWRYAYFTFPAVSAMIKNREGNLCNILCMLSRYFPPGLRW
jgi:hypothetical protein